MLDQFLTLSTLWNKVARICLFFFLAWLVHRLASRIAGRIVRLSRFTPEIRRPRPERQETLQGLIASAISVVALAAATLASVGQFVDATTVVWMVGLFSAAFGLGARPLIGDVLAGINLIFEDALAMGEKVELLGVEGVIEEVNLRTTWMRAPTGELYIVPNGEVRVVRNFSRGRFSTADIKLKIAATDLNRALPLLQELGKLIGAVAGNQRIRCDRATDRADAVGQGTLRKGGRDSSSPAGAGAGTTERKRYRPGKLTGFDDSGGNDEKCDSDYPETA